MTRGDTVLSVQLTRLRRACVTFSLTKHGKSKVCAAERLEYKVF